MIELRDLRSGDLWGNGSDQYKDFDEGQGGSGWNSYQMSRFPATNSVSSHSKKRPDGTEDLILRIG